MALDPKLLKRFLDNPASFSAEDMGLQDENGESLAPNESEDGALEVPEVDPEADMLEQAPEIADPDEVEQEVDLEDDEAGDLKPAAPQVDSDIMTKLKKLKAGESLDEMSESQDEEISSDIAAPMELRKKALQKIKQKYLGQ